ncbi:LOW QUALITY PROTEIN: hypothetical protein PHMEG_00027069 [Phytophthora megakarya]|uniref:MULE transposase domain-containing protein n=1 Tax=Phytophthora megakarya TaxID=4795 RepID=A0A225V8U5_9STRA|nr:LOW QUALITY PROTEIN: hypothetical protein PHMEG_00027069 [Phytophthora megakarya]
MNKDSNATAYGNPIEEMQQYVDILFEQCVAAKMIWPMAYEKFYQNSTRVVAGLSHKQVMNRVANANKEIYSQSPALAKVKNDVVGFLKFNSTWHDDSRAKERKSGIERIVGWAHPELRKLLRYSGVHLFVDGTFRCTPKAFRQFVTLLMYDPLTNLFALIIFTLATNKTQDLYTKMFQRIGFALGTQPDPFDVGHFPSTGLIGRLFHFKQASRRKMKELRLPDKEVTSICNGLT